MSSPSGAACFGLRRACPACFNGSFAFSRPGPALPDVPGPAHICHWLTLPAYTAAAPAQHSLRPGPAGWEDGTPPFLDFPAVAAGLRFIERLGGFPAVAGEAPGCAANWMLTSCRSAVCRAVQSWRRIIHCRT